MGSTQGLEFEATVDSDQGGGIEIPFDVREIFGRAKPPVLVTVNDHTYRSTVAAYSGTYLVPLNKANAAAAGVKGGEPFTVTIAEDTEPRTVEVPDDLAKALKEAGVRPKWDALSYTKQREGAESVEGAKRAETRTRRIARIVDDLR